MGDTYNRSHVYTYVILLFIGFIGVMSAQNATLSSVAINSNTLNLSRYLSTGGNGGGVCVNAYIAGSCYGGAVEAFTTTYGANGGQLVGVGPVLPNTNEIPVSERSIMQDVYNYNLANNQYLITCPNAPNPSNPYEYFTTNTIPYEYGDSCLSTPTPLVTTLSLVMKSYWTQFTPVSTSIITGIRNGVSGTLQNLGYAREVNDSGKLYLSDSYSSNSYAFQEPQGENQSFIWSWLAKYANFNNAQPLTASYSGKGELQTIGGLGFCLYSYSFKIGAKATFKNNFLPVPIGLNGNVPKSYDNVSLLPQLFYDAQVPVLSSSLTSNAELLNMNYSLYSPVNFNSANSLDPFNVGTGGDLIANVSVGSKYMLARIPPNSISFTSPQPSELSNYVTEFGDVIGHNTGNSFIDIVNPSFVSVSPNNKIYVLNYTDKCDFLCFGSTYSTYLFQLSSIPNGDYNLSNIEVPQSSVYTTQSNWDSAWQNYWKSAIENLYSGMYVTSLAPVSSSYSGLWGFYTDPGSSSAIMQNTIPTAIASDYEGDVFIVALKPSSGLNSIECILPFSSCPKEFVIAGLYAPGSGGNNLNMRTERFATIKYPIHPSDIAVSPNGRYIYLSSPSSGNILVLNGNSLTIAGTIDLAYSNLNIASYLGYDGGPFNSSQVRSAYANLAPQQSSGNTASGTSSGGIVVPDTANNHHPVGISDYDGLLYVLDNWSFTVNGQSSSIMMLRAFSYAGTEVPIDSRFINDLSSSPQTGVTSSQSTVTSVSTVSSLQTAQPPLLHNNGTNISLQGYTQGIGLGFGSGSGTNSITSVQSTGLAGGYPPYGWPISANISIGGSGTVSYCAAECTFSPSGLPTSDTFGYLPIGPMIKSSGEVSSSSLQDIGFTVDFNNTGYLIAHTSGNNKYTELLEFRMNIENYTTVSLGANSSYMCMLNISNAPGSTCTTGASELKSIYPPLEGDTSPFSFAEIQGSPQRLIALQNEFSASFPFGLNNTSAFSSSANSLSKNGIGSDTNSIVSTAVSSSGTTALTTITPVNTYIQSKIDGYFDLPYTVEIDRNVSYNETGVTKEGYLVICTNTQAQLDFWWLVYGGQTSSKKTYFELDRSPASSTTSNIIIQGGPSYGVFNLTGDLYNTNLSDAGLIITPDITLSLLTDRMIGEFWANLSVSPYGALPRQLVLNATHLLSYEMHGFAQVTSLGGIHPGYTQEAPVTSVETGVDCKLCLLPNYYYNPASLFSGKASLAYTPGNDNNPLTVFQLYKLLIYKNGISLNLQSSSPTNLALLGYDRIVYMYSDAFNNTIAMPLDVNLANITTLTLNTTTAVSPSNPNQTTVSVNGNAGYYGGIFGGYAPLPQGSPIYIYYDTNINYLNPSNTPLSNPSSYFEYSEQCAFSGSASINGYYFPCETANPLAEYTQGNMLANTPSSPGVTTTTSTSTSSVSTSLVVLPIIAPQAVQKNDSIQNGTSAAVPIEPQLSIGVGSASNNAYLTESNFVDYAPSYNLKGDCTNTPHGLLTPPQPANCNIYGRFGLPATSYSVHGAFEYCAAYASDGNGTLTSQLGLVGIATVGSGGTFSLKFTACGVEKPVIIADWYGFPGPEPAKVSQPDLINSVSFAGSNPSNDISTYEYNYAFSPNETSETISTGSYLLSFGYINAIIILLIGAALAALFIKRFVYG